jgi:hypothetical protein
MARFSVGEKVIAFRYIIRGKKGLFGNPMFWPGEDVLDDVKMHVLTVDEHHMVAWDQDPNQEKKYDGFLLKDATGQVWSNQYPTAAYGQISDAADWRFDMKFPDNADFNTLSDEQLAVFEDVTQVIDRVKRGIDQMKGSSDGQRSVLAEQLQVHLNWLTKKVKKETGADVVFTPIWKDHPEITHATLVWPQ